MRILHPMFRTIACAALFLVFATAAIAVVKPEKDVIRVRGTVREPSGTLRLR